MGIFIGFTQKQKVKSKKKRLNKSKTNPIELKRYRFNIQNQELRVLLDKSLKINDPYMITDWLPNHISISINTNHPFWKKIKNDNKKISTYIHMLVVDAFTQWRILKYTSQITPSNLLEIKDSVKREIAIESIQL